MEHELTAEQRWRKYWWTLAIGAAGGSSLAVGIVGLASMPRDRFASTWLIFIMLASVLTILGTFLGERYRSNKAIEGRLNRESPAMIGRVLFGGGIGAGFYFFPAPPPIFNVYGLFLGVLFGAVMGMIAHIFALYRFEPGSLHDAKEGSV